MPTERPYSTFREFRKGRGLTQDAVAALAGVSQAEISQGERRGFNPGVADRLVDYFKLPKRLFPLREKPARRPRARQ